MILLSTAYWGNVHYYSKIISGIPCLIDLHETYLKQSFRNRCDILSANGVISLVVPVLKTHGQRMCTKDARIDHATSWQQQHWRSLVSCYRSAPYFEHYEDELALFYEKKFVFLADLNLSLMEQTLDWLEVDPMPAVCFSDDYIRAQIDDPNDFRVCISPKESKQRPDPSFVSMPYYQVFSERMPFAPNLSIIDLLLCEGPYAKKFLIM